MHESLSKLKSFDDLKRFIKEQQTKHNIIAKDPNNYVHRELFDTVEGIERQLKGCLSKAKVYFLFYEGNKPLVYYADIDLQTQKILHIGSENL